MKRLGEWKIIEILNAYIAPGVENRIVFGKQVARKAEDEYLRQIVEWGNEPCPHQVIPAGGKLYEGWLRRECDRCWEELEVKK